MPHFFPAPRSAGLLGEGLVAHSAGIQEERASLDSHPLTGTFQQKGLVQINHIETDLLAGNSVRGLRGGSPPGSRLGFCIFEEILRDYISIGHAGGGRTGMAPLSMSAERTDRNINAAEAAQTAVLGPSLVEQPYMELLVLGLASFRKCCEELYIEHYEPDSPNWWALAVCNSPVRARMLSPLPRKDPSSEVGWLPQAPQPAEGKAGAMGH